MKDFIFNFFNIKTKEEKFWIWFVENCNNYFENGEKNKSLDIEIRKRLQKIKKGLVFILVSKNKENKHELIISSNGRELLFPIIKEMIEISPKLNNWTFTSFISRLINDKPNNVTHIDKKHILSDIYFRYEIDKNNKMNIEFNIRNFNGTNTSMNMIRLLIFSLLGEYDFVKNTKYIDYKLLDESKKETLLSTTELVEVFDKLIN